MRFRDASHVQIAEFYARGAHGGRWFRVGGWAAVALAVIAEPWSNAEGALLGVVLATWLVAWRLAVGALWRSSLVAAAVVCAVAITRGQLDPTSVAGLLPPGALPS
jgi:hypothetical protein